MYSNSGCYTKKQLESCSFMQYEIITLDSILFSEIPIKDKIWFVVKVIATKKQNQAIAIAFAEILLDVFKAKYSERKPPYEAIEAAKQYCNNEISIEQLRETRRSIHYYSASLNHSTVAYAAYIAAYVVAYSFDDDATSISVSSAVYAAYEISDSYSFKAELLQSLIKFCNNN